MDQTMGLKTSAENCLLWKLPTQTQQGELLSIKLLALDKFSFPSVGYVCLYCSEHDWNKIFISLGDGVSVTLCEYKEIDENIF